MIHDNFYYQCGDRLFIVPSKNASTSFRYAMNVRIPVKRVGAERLNKNLETIAIIRHPFDRVVSALYSGVVSCGAGPFAAQWRRSINNHHVHPQWSAFDGLRVDHWIRFDQLPESWDRLGFPELPHRRKGKVRPKHWKDEDCDWSEFMPLYERDFNLCPDWERP